jgi:hypothetical protein
MIPVLEFIMGRIAVNVKIKNLFDQDKAIQIDALVETGAAQMVLPTAWKDRLGNLNTIRTVASETATQDIVNADICGPVEIQLEGFDPVYGEILFLEMHPHNGEYEPLVGYIVLEQSQAAVDRLGHRLFNVKKTDLKAVLG